MLTSLIIVGMKDINADLKNFISQTVSQIVLESEARLRKDFIGMFEVIRKEFDDKLNSKFESLQAEMRAGFAAMDEAFDNLARIRDQDRDYMEKTFIRHDREITILQKQIAPTSNL